MKQEISGAGHTLRAAMCSVSITPVEDEYLEGYESHGELSLCRFPQDHTSDIKARLLLVDNGLERALFLNLELLFADVQHRNDILSEDCMARISRACGASEDHIFLSNTHTHHAPLRLTEAQRRNIVEAAARAAELLQPAKLFAGTGHTVYGVSRSNDYGIDKLRAYDDLLTVLRFENAQTGRPIGLVYSVPIHNTLFGHGPGLKVNRHLLSCEFTGYASRTMEEKFREENPDFTAMHHNGFYGNAGPIYQERFYVPSQEILKEAGAALAEEVLEVSKKAEESDLLTGGIASCRTETSLPVKADKGFAEYFGDHDPMPLLIHTGAVGGLAYAGVNFEPFAGLGAHIRAESPYRTLFPAANINGWNGYIPTKETFAAHEKELEVECQDIKTPLTAEADSLFCRAVGETLCRMKQVKALRRDAVFQGCGHEGTAAVLHFAFSEAAVLDKLVIAFGQIRRSDCAEDFVLEAFDEAGEHLLRQEEKSFSSGWYGCFVSGAVSRVRLTVTKRFGTEMAPDSLRPALYGLHFVPLES